MRRNPRHTLRAAVSVFVLAVLIAGLPARNADPQIVAPPFGKADPDGWLDAEGARIRLLLASAAPDGTIEGALEIDLAPGFKTYWIGAGPAGIAPQLEAFGSANARLVGIDYPAPVAFDELYGWSVGYDHDVAFPLRFEMADPEADATVRLRGVLGVCGEICIPVSLSFEQDVVTGMSTPLEAGRSLAAARDALPATGADGALTASSDGEAVTLRGNALANARDVYVAAPDGLTLDPPRIEDGVVRIPIVRGDAGGPATVIVRGTDGAETVYRVAIPDRSAS